MRKWSSSFEVHLILQEPVRTLNHRSILNFPPWHIFVLKHVMVLSTSYYSDHSEVCRVYMWSTSWPPTKPIYGSKAVLLPPSEWILINLQNSSYILSFPQGWTHADSLCVNSANEDQWGHPRRAWSFCQRLENPEMRTWGGDGAGALGRGKWQCRQVSERLEENEPLLLRT